MPTRFVACGECGGGGVASSTLRSSAIVLIGRFALLVTALVAFASRTMLSGGFHEA